LDQAELPIPEAAEPGFPNKMGRILLTALDEVMGRTGLNSLLTAARLQHLVEEFPPNDFEKGFSFTDVAQMMQTLEELYGVRSGRGIARKAGRACFRLGIGDFGPVLWLVDLAFRVLALHMRMRIGFEILAETFNRFTDQKVLVELDSEHFHWVMEPCAECWGRTCDSPCCQLAMGLLEEVLFWVSNGKRFYMEEVSCIACGDSACEILIGRDPLE